MSIDRNMEEEEHATDEEEDKTEPTEFDVALMNDMLWDMEGQGRKI